MTADCGPSTPSRNPGRSPSEKAPHGPGGSCWTKLWLLLPVGWGLWLVHAYGANVIFNDEWSLVPLFHGIAERTTDLTSLWAQSNEHRMFFPRLLLFACAELSQFSVKVPMFLGQLWILAAYIWVLKYMDDPPRTAPGDSWQLGGGLLAGVVLFNTMQYENFLWGFQMAFLMLMSLAVSGFYAVHCAIRDGRKRWVCAAMTLGILASFTVLQGLLVWPVYVAMFMLAARESAARSVRRAVWVGGLGLLVWAAYFTDYRKPGWSPDYLGAGLFHTTGYFLASVGGFAATRYAGFAMATGLLALSLAAALVVDLWRRRRMRDNVFAVGLILFSYAVSAAIAVGRSGNGDGIANAMTSRYSTFGLLSYLGMLLIGLRERNHWLDATAPRSWSSRAIAILLAVFGALVVGKAALYVLPAREWSAQRRAEIDVIRNYRTASAEQLGNLKPFADAEAARANIERLEQFRWNVFAEDP